MLSGAEHCRAASNIAERILCARKYLTSLFDGRLLCKQVEIDFEAYRTRTAATTPAPLHDGIL